MSLSVIIILAFQIIGIIILLIILLRKNSNELPNLYVRLSSLEATVEKMYSSINDDSARNREEFNKNARGLREEIQMMLSLIKDSFNTNLTINLNHLNKQLSENSKENREEMKAGLLSFEDKIERLKETVYVQLNSLQSVNSSKLDEMRNLVEEKLQSTLEKRLGESFKQVSDRLERVHQGLGDMKNLASGVGDLKKVLSNVKNRGILGEYQLANLLEQILNRNQYESNLKCKEDSDFRVEYAIKIPSRDQDSKFIYLPIDAKFPLENYYQLQEAYNNGDTEIIEENRKNLAIRMKQCAKDISKKYINPPFTTDFAIMFLPTEGLYAEVLSKIGLFEEIHQKYRVVISGPTTLGALLNSLQMGFKTFAIEKRSGQVWKLLGEIKKEFGNFGNVLQETQKSILGANKKLDDLIGTRTRAIERKLRDVEELPVSSENKNILD